MDASNVTSPDHHFVRSADGTGFHAVLVLDLHHSGEPDDYEAIVVDDDGRRLTPDSPSIEYIGLASTPVRFHLATVPAGATELLWRGPGLDLSLKVPAR